jgi:hypothetical protein
VKSQEKGQDIKGKIGDGHVRGMAKQGLEELRAALYPGSNIAQPTGYGIFGKETPGEVAMQRDGPEADQEGGVLGERFKAAEAKRDGKNPPDSDKSKEDRGPELE